MLTKLVPAAGTGAGKDTADEAGETVVPGNRGGEVEDTPESDEVSGVGVVFNVADGTVRDERRGGGGSFGG